MSTIWDEILGRENVEEEAQTPSFDIEGISRLTLFELSKRNMAIEIHSEFLGCNVWLCSNEGMVKHVKGDDPKGVCYTIDELRELIRLHPTPEEIEGIHNAKSVFKDSKIVDSRLKKEELPKELK
ncbi:hypothetical protein MYX76_16635 [Desulfobacterota bacterium AH_259_B03_O07]|nr:hypothetical protein [Desulfobacterota bacterium AH_259_B03_O07]